MSSAPLASFPGVNQVVSCSFTLGHGITPGVATLVIAPQSDFEGAGGMLSLFDGQTEIDFPDCKLDRHTFQTGPRGQVWRLQILDRRWKWRWGQISGSYNLRHDDGTVDLGTQQTPQQLATLCLQAMGEADYDVSALPNDARPTVEWDFDVPAAALAHLCDELGCRVVLQLDNSVSLCEVGVGNDLPAGPVIENGPVLDPPEQPDAMSVVCGRDRYQADFLLEAVGLDTDDTIVPIDELSYRPAAGWSACDIPGFTAVAADCRAQAKATVFRWYRIRVPAEIPDYGQIDSLDQILPIEDEQIDTVSTTVDGMPVVQNKPAQVYGSFFKHAEDWKNNIPAGAIDPNAFEGTSQECSQPLRIDRDLGIVKFGDYVFANLADSGSSLPAGLTVGPATLRLRTAVSVKDSATLAPERHERDRSYGGDFDTPTRYLKHDEIVLTHVAQYGSDYSIQAVTTNSADVDQACDYYLDAAERQYQLTLAQTVKYVGLQSIELDGAIRQVSWDIGPAGCTTTASRNDEQLHRSPSYEEMRALERTRILGRLDAQQRPSAMRQNLKAIAYRK